jgi:beta-galactosidase
MTPKSLGYVTLPLKPRKGSAVRIELNGVADESNAIKLTEVANQAIADTGANQIGKGVLSIVEAEFYRAP